MKRDRISMATQAQIFTLYDKGHAVRKIALSLGMCRRTIRRYLKRKNHSENHFKKEEHSQKQNEKSDAEIISDFPKWLQDLDWKTILYDLKKGVSYINLYKESNLKQVKYWSFWKQINRLDKLLNPKEPKTTMRIIHNPGEKAFVDYTDGIDIVDQNTSEIKKTYLFIGCLPFSSKTYAEFCFDQKLPTFIASHERMWKFFNGVIKSVVCDNLKSGVSVPRLYDPDANKVFVSYANHAGFAVLPARPRRPKDKANVETHAGILQRSFYQEVRNHVFSSIGELNDALKVFLNKFNDKIMKDYGISRNERFEKEIPFLKEVKHDLFYIPEIKESTVHPDCHIQFQKCFYSVPWQYVGKKVRVISGNQIEIFDILTLEKIAVHSCCKQNGERRTNPLHWPPEKNDFCDFSTERGLEDAKKIGEKTYEMVEYLFSLPHPLVYLRRVQGWLKHYSRGFCSKNAMEYASQMAFQHKKFNYSYFNDCAKHFDSCGLNQVCISNAPKRDFKHLHLQK